jgi:transposase
MMGKQERSESLFYYIRLEDLIPENHLLRLVDRHIDLSFVRERLRPFYSSVGRPSIDPEVLMRLLLVGYLYGITSERHLMEEVRMHLGYRWFSGLGLEQEVPDHSTFSKNRHGRFREAGIFREVFERLAQVSRTVREYLEELERENPVGDAEAVPEQVSTTDPDARWCSKGGPARMAYFDNYLMDAISRVIVEVEATPAAYAQEARAAKRMLERVQARGLGPQSVRGDMGYGKGEFLTWLVGQGIEPHIPPKDHRRRIAAALTQEDFRYAPEENVYYCPEGKPLRYHAQARSNQAHVYRSNKGQCQGCPLKPRCTTGPYRSIAVSWHEPARQVVWSLVGTPAYQQSHRARYRIEALFAELKQRLRLSRVRLRRLWNVAEQFQLAATVQNIKRLLAFLTRPAAPPVPNPC